MQIPSQYCASEIPCRCTICTQWGPPALRIWFWRACVRVLVHSKQSLVCFCRYWVRKELPVPPIRRCMLGSVKMAISLHMAGEMNERSNSKKWMDNTKRTERQTERNADRKKESAPSLWDCTAIVCIWGIVFIWAPLAYPHLHNPEHGLNRAHHYPKMLQLDRCRRNSTICVDWHHV
jgi:hypothetical protein